MTVTPEETMERYLRRAVAGGWEATWPISWCEENGEEWRVDSVWTGSPSWQIRFSYGSRGIMVGTNQLPLRDFLFDRGIAEAAWGNGLYDWQDALESILFAENPVSRIAELL